MFTGIITGIGTVTRIVQHEDMRIEISCPFNTNDLDIGASVACSGACMTVIDKGPNWFGISVSEESLSKTTLGAWTEGTKINLERSLRFGDEMGGHIVSGHVDGVGSITHIEPEGGSTRITIEAPKGLSRFIASKGSITIDGISLTVNDVRNNFFDINIIPHTREVTTLSGVQIGTTVNLEIDMLARYVARLQEAKN